MTTRYVGIGGNDGNSGLTWALRKLTLNGVEDTPVVANDTIYVGPGTYRELLTCDVSGTAGNPITYIGDYSGVNTDGVGGVVRITGSDNDQTATRASCVLAGAAINYRTFQGFSMDGCTGNFISSNSFACTNWIIQKSMFKTMAASSLIRCDTQSNNWTIQECTFFGQGNANVVLFFHSSTYSDSANLVQNCLFMTGNPGILSTRVGGITVKNSVFTSRNGVQVGTALAGGQTVTVNNCIFAFETVALSATVAGEIVENYNTFSGNNTDRTNTNTGANSVTYPPLFDSRWFFELVSGKGRMVSPFDLASYSQLVNLAGTSPSTTDMRGTAVIGAQREYGALEYDPTLLFRRVIERRL